MGCPRMAKLTTIAIVLLACSTSRSEEIYRKNDPWRSIERKARAIRKIFRVIANGTSSEEDDEKLVNLIKQEIVRTAQSIKTPTGSLEAAARRAQRLVTELTAAYTTAIYKSETSQEAKLNFARFQHTVQEIVDFIKNGRALI
ncbi:uncharacterized protein LOC143182086 [Calliopsis andreniformis]|uniref:uncharacterized protein LOC143182086 n=1 Tax=Calliopsis andreniformis TaxID=337506 RepID=UPI003FCE0F1B